MQKFMDERLLDSFISYSIPYMIRFGMNPCLSIPSENISQRSLQAEIQTMNTKKPQIKKEVSSLFKELTSRFNEIKFQHEKNIFELIKKSLLKNEKYLNKFVAIHQGKIIDYDEDNIKLAKRAYSEYGYIPIYFGKVSKKERVFDFSSPE